MEHYNGLNRIPGPTQALLGTKVILMERRRSRKTVKLA
jgi:hypothetical protein